MSALRIIQAEGIDCEASLLGCYISHNNVLQDIITPLAPDHSVSLPHEGLVKITMKNMSEDSKIIGSVVFPLEILTKEQFWLPLQGDQVLSVLPDSPALPRIKIAMDSYENSCELSPESNIITVSDEENDYPRLRLQLKMQAFSLQEMSSELTTTKASLKNELCTIQLLETKLSDTQKDYSQFVVQAQGREKSMLRLLEQKDVEIAENINQTLKLQGFLDRLLEDKRHVEEKLACLQTVACNDETEMLREQVGQLKYQLIQEDKRRQELQDMLLQIGKEWRETEDQEKLNTENKLVRAEQEMIRAKGSIQGLNAELEKVKSMMENKINEEICVKREVARMECEIAGLEGKVRGLEEEILRVKEENMELGLKVEGKDKELDGVNERNTEMTERIEELLEKTRRITEESEKSSEELEEERRNHEKTIEKLQQEKMYSERLYDQIIQARFHSDALIEKINTPSVESLVESILKSLKRENAITWTDGKSFFENSEISLVKRSEHTVDVKTATGMIPLADFIYCPKTPSIRKRNSQEIRENDLENISYNSSFSIDPEKSFIINKKSETKSKSFKPSLISQKVPLKDKNTRVGSVSVERRRAFK